MKANILSFLFLFISILSFGENIIIKGRVVSKENDSPISYASVSVFNELKGTSTSINGEFKLELDKDYYEKDIVVSSIGYYDTIIPVNQLTDEFSLISLRSKTYEIGEATVIACKKKEVIIDKLRKSFMNQYATTGSTDPKIIAKYFEYEPDYKGLFINEISIFFNREFDYELQPLFILRLFSKDTLNDCPGNDLIEKTIINLEASKQKSHYKFTYQFDESIIFPENGIYIAIEWIAIEENKYTAYNKNYYSPSLAAKMRDNEDTNLWEFYGGNWKLKKSLTNINTQPYIELRLVN